MNTPVNVVTHGVASTMLLYFVHDDKGINIKECRTHTEEILAFYLLQAGNKRGNL
jgi:hypothetical protein